MDDNGPLEVFIRLDAENWKLTFVPHSETEEKTHKIKLIATSSDGTQITDTISVKVKTYFYPSLKSTQGPLRIPLYYDSQSYSIPSVENSGDYEHNIQNTYDLPDWASWSSSSKKYSFTPNDSSLGSTSYTFTLDFNVESQEEYSGSYFGAISSSGSDLDSFN
jgi:hypothetical protein